MKVKTNLNCDGNKVNNLGTGVAGTDAVNLTQVQGLVTGKATVNGTPVTGNVAIFTEDNGIEDGGELGTAAAQSIDTFLQTASNLSDLPDVDEAKSNLGLGTTSDVQFGSVGASYPTINVAAGSETFILDATNIGSLVLYENGGLVTLAESTSLNPECGEYWHVRNGGSDPLIISTSLDTDQLIGNSTIAQNGLVTIIHTGAKKFTVAPVYQAESGLMWYAAPAPLGNDSNDGLSMSTPFATFDQVMGARQPGESITLLDGFQIDNSGDGFTITDDCSIFLLGSNISLLKDLYAQGCAVNFVGSVLNLTEYGTLNTTASGTINADSVRIENSGNGYDLQNAITVGYWDQSGGNNVYIKNLYCKNPNQTPGYVTENYPIIISNFVNNVIIENVIYVSERAESTNHALLCNEGAEGSIVYIGNLTHIDSCTQTGSIVSSAIFNHNASCPVIVDNYSLITQGTIPANPMLYLGRSAGCTGDARTVFNNINVSYGLYPNAQIGAASASTSSDVVIINNGYVNTTGSYAMTTTGSGKMFYRYQDSTGVMQTAPANYLRSASNLSDINNAALARSNLGLGTAATQATGTFLQAASNLLDLPNTVTARTNLGLGTAATQATGTFLQAASNLLDLPNTVTARTNLGLGTAATQATGTFLQAASNLLDLPNTVTARTNLGLGTAATQATGTFLQVANNFNDLNNATTCRTNLGLGTSSSVQFLGIGSGTTGSASIGLNLGSFQNPIHASRASGGYSYFDLNNTTTRLITGVDTAVNMGTTAAFAGNFVGDNFMIATSSAAKWMFTGSAIYPMTDNSATIGINTNRLASIWCVNATINTSDRNAKTEIEDSPLGLSFINTLRPVRYKMLVGGKKENVIGWKDAPDRDPKDKSAPLRVAVLGDPIEIPGNRIHYGLIAQEFKEALDAANVGDCAVWVKADMNDPDSEEGLRYEEMIPILMKAVQELSAKVDALEQINGSSV